MPLKREETDSFRLGFMEVVDVPGDKPRVVVERNWDILLLGVVSVRVALESERVAPKPDPLGDNNWGSLSMDRARSGLAYGCEYYGWEPPVDGVEEWPKTARLSPYIS